MAPLNVLSGGPSVGSVHPRRQARATCCRWREREHQWPQRARRVLPLSGRLARDRSCLWAADEHADRPRSCRSMLRQHMLIMHVDRVEIMKNADLVHALCA